MSFIERNVKLREQNSQPDLGIGLGLRCPHYAHVLNESTEVQWFEALSENYFGLLDQSGGRPIRVLEKVREKYPVVLHGVSLSIGSTDALDMEYLRKLKNLVDRIEPALVSDHLCWTGVNGKNLHDLLPLPYTEEVISHVVARIARVQDFLGRRMLFENASSYLSYKHSEMTEWEFVAEVARRSDCGLLLDVNNVYVSATNHGFDPIEYLDGIPGERVAQIHLAGHSEQDGILIDTHDEPVPEPVWALYREAIRRLGAVPTMIERDANIPEFRILEAEALRAGAIRKEAIENERSNRAAGSRDSSALDCVGDYRLTRSGARA